MKRALPLPARFVLLILVVVVAPLGAMGYWLAGTAARSGEELLRQRLRQTNARIAAEIAGEYLRARSELLAFADDDAVQRTLDAHAGVAPYAEEAWNPAELRARFDALVTPPVELTMRHVSGTIVGRLGREAPGVPTFGTTLPVTARVGGHTLGTLEMRWAGEDILGPTGASSATVGAVVAVIDPVGGASLRGLPFDPSVLGSPRFDWEREVWIAERRTLLDPRLDVVSAAPLAEFSAPFEVAARDGVTILIAVTLLATVLATVLTRRMTRSLAQLALAADSVSRGTLTARVPLGRSDEVGRVAEAFNRMAERLRETLAELSQREALAAVGSFASELAHEVRNPLTSIKVDLQHVEESLPEGSELRGVLRSAVAQVDHLDRTVSGVLQIARSGQIVTEPLDIREPLRAALDVVRSTAPGAGPIVRMDVSDSPLTIPGDRNALQRLFTNLLTNAVEAASKPGTVEVRAFASGDAVEVTIRDDGRGISPELLARVREPFFTTRPQGTGLGLAIADRIAAAHGATLTIGSEPVRGTVVTMRFPPGPRVDLAPLRV